MTFIENLQAVAVLLVLVASAAATVAFIGLMVGALL